MQKLSKRRQRASCDHQYRHGRMPKATPTPPCPNCATGTGRWLELKRLGETQVSSFICVICGHFWDAALVPVPAKVLPFNLAGPRRES
jgi:hypothetical protein